MRKIKFRVWHRAESKMYFLGYQKLTHVLLCRDDGGENGGRGLPVKRAQYDACELLESTGVFDYHGNEIFEGDIVRVRAGSQSFSGVVESIPDMFKSRGLHPLQPLLERGGISKDQEGVEFKVMGNRYETPDLLPEK